MKRDSAQPPAVPARSPAWLRAGLIALAVAFVFGPAVTGGWLWDDNQEVSQNAVLRDPGGLMKIWTGSAGADYFPLKTTLQWFEWRLWGDQPAGYHAVSILLHLAAALLLWRLLQRLGVRFGWIGGLLFAVHPLAVESVAWAAELKNTLAEPLLLLALLAWVDFDRDGKPRAYALALLFFLLAMLAKSSVVMFPLALLLYAWWRRKRVAASDLRAAAPFFGVSLVLGAVTFWFQHHRAMQPEDLSAAGGMLSRLACAGLALGFYLVKSVFPVGLSPIYPRWELDPPSAAQFLPWLAWIALAAWLWSRRSAWSRATLLALGWFVLNLLPVAGFVVITYMRITWVADHFAYLSLLAVAGLAAAGLDRAAARWGAWPAAAALGVCGLLALESRGYAARFHDEDALWTYTIERNPAAWSAHYNLGTWLAHRGELPRAERELEEAIRLRPRFADAHFNLGNTFFLEQRLPEAMAEYREAIGLQPARADFHVGLGSALYFSGRRPEALAEYEQALRLRPGDPQIERNLAIARQSPAP